MERLNKVVLEVPQDMHYEATIGEEGELILRVVPNSSEKLEDKATFSQNHTAEEPEDKAKFFTKITAEDREKVRFWLTEQKRKAVEENRFLKDVEEALKRVGTDYWIATLEPSVVAGRIYYAEGEEVGVGYSCKQWKKMAEEYAPERLSRLSNRYELFIWYALRIVNGLWTLDYVAEDSSSEGNYWNAPGSVRFMEKTGARKCGGFYDGQGNSYRIVTWECGYMLVGGGYNQHGRCSYVADVSHINKPGNILDCGVGVLVLVK